MSTLPVRTIRVPSKSLVPSYIASRRREFHDYFVTHLPSSSLHPDSRSTPGPHHKLPRNKSVPHTPGSIGRSPAAPPPSVGLSRETTVVRIPIRSAKHHFGVSLSRGTRPYNEDTFQAGTIEIPAFAKTRPVSLSRRPGDREGTAAESASGDPQVFYFGVFDGHGGVECSEWLSERLHEYIEDGGKLFELQSTLKRRKEPHKGRDGGESVSAASAAYETSEDKDALAKAGKESLQAIKTYTPDKVKRNRPSLGEGEENSSTASERKSLGDGGRPLKETEPNGKAQNLEASLVAAWRETVGGYFRRFKPQFFSLSAGGKGHILEQEVVRGDKLTPAPSPDPPSDGPSIESVLTYAFLRADLDFVAAQASKRDQDDPVQSDRALNADDILSSSRPASQNFRDDKQIKKQIGGPTRFEGGSTASIVLVCTPTPTPFWHPASPSTLISAHVGDTRTLLCATSTGLAIPLTTNHHPSSPIEAGRLRRYATTFVTDSFGEERMGSFANTRAFGDVGSKRIGISAEPEIRRVEMAPAEYSFIALMSDGVSGALSDQEICDIVKEARTPEQAARDVVAFATDVGEVGDNATCLVVRLGGWERRMEGGVGSMGTKEMRDWRRAAAADPRSKMR